MKSSFRKKTLAVIVICLMMLMSLPIVMGATHNESGPVLDVQIRTGFQFVEVPFEVKNIGDETAHNVTLTDIAINGSVHYTNRDSTLTGEFNPGYWNIYFIDSYFIGYGFFSITLTVTCDEGVFYSDKTNGLIIGPFMFIL